MPEPNHNLHDLATRMVDTPHSKALGIRVVSIGDSSGVMEVPWQEALVVDPDTGLIAGGVVTSLLDQACGLAITAATGASSGFGIATLDLRIDYMRPATSRASLKAEGRCYKLTRSIAFVRGHAWDTDPAEPIATAQAAFMMTGRS